LEKELEMYLWENIEKWNKVKFREKIKPINVEINALVGGNYSLQYAKNLAGLPQVPTQNLRILHSEQHTANQQCHTSMSCS